MEPGELVPRYELDVTLLVNGTPHRVTVEARTTLLDTLRDRLHLTGTKKAANLGQCRACTVRLNGKWINACLTLAAMHDGFHKREPGSGCPAQDGENRLNAILGGSVHCIATYPGDLAVAPSTTRSAAASATSRSRRRKH